MRFIIWTPVVIAVAIWSLFSWMVYGFVDWIAGLFAGVFGAVLGGWASWLIDGLGDIGQGLIVIIWLLVAWWMTGPARRWS